MVDAHRADMMGGAARVPSATTRQVAIPCSDRNAGLRRAHAWGNRMLRWRSRLWRRGAGGAALDGTARREALRRSRRRRVRHRRGVDGPRRTTWRQVKWLGSPTSVRPSESTPMDVDGVVVVVSGRTTPPKPLTSRLVSESTTDDGGVPDEPARATTPLPATRLATATVLRGRCRVDRSRRSTLYVRAGRRPDHRLLDPQHVDRLVVVADDGEVLGSTSPW